MSSNIHGEAWPPGSYVIFEYSLACNIDSCSGLLLLFKNFKSGRVLDLYLTVVRLHNVFYVTFVNTTSCVSSLSPTRREIHSLLSLPKPLSLISYSRVDVPLSKIWSLNNIWSVNYYSQIVGRRFSCDAAIHDHFPSKWKFLASESDSFH